jgi:hypothetical protein
LSGGNGSATQSVNQEQHGVSVGPQGQKRTGQGTGISAVTVPGPPREKMREIGNSSAQAENSFRSEFVPPCQGLLFRRGRPEKDLGIASNAFAARGQSQPVG